MKITVLIATRNRSEWLRQTLNSLFSEANLRVPGWEVLVIDNGSKDGTPQVCREFMTAYPEHFRTCVQNAPGKSHSFNLGIAEARGEILALMDDDVICAPNYIANVLNVFEVYSADAAQTRIFLDCEGGQPEWMSEEHCKFMTGCDYGEEVQDAFPHALFGTNMLVRAEAVRAIGGYAPELGPGSAVGFADDTDVTLRLRWAGYRIIYAPQVVVRHQLPRSRLTRRFFRNRYFLLGRSRAYYQPYPTPLWRFGVYAVKNWIVSDLRSWWLRISGHPADALDCQCQARKGAGFFWQHVLFWRGLPRRLSRVTSWADLVTEASGKIEPPKEDEQKIGLQATRG